MSIAKSDIKLMASERLTDFFDGGGAMTGNEIVSGELNNLFPDISRLDRTYGRVSLRKCFPAVDTENSDMYYGAHAIMTDPPDDDNVFVTMFSRDDFDDTRQDAKDRIESYVTIAGETLLRPMYDQLEGQRAVVCFQAVGNSAPEVGETIVLKNSSTGQYQYIRITGIATEKTTFQTETATFSVDVVTMDLSAALEYTFPGIAPTPNTTRAITRIHKTTVADASKYYGVSKVTKAIAQGDFHMQVDSIYNQLVPTSQIESAVVDQYMGGDTFTYYPKGEPGSLTFSGSRSNSAPMIHLSDGVMPGSLQINIGGYDFVDTNGVLTAVDEDSTGGYTGTVDYASGQVYIEKTSWTATVTLTATPACPVSESYMSIEIPIELENRGYNYTPNLSDPLPQPGNIKVDYMAQGKWYRLYDDGRGVFTSDLENVGTGTVDYVSGSCVITLGALPDVGTSIIVSWGVGVAVEDATTQYSAEPVSIRGALTNIPVIPGSVTLTWNDGTERTLTDESGSWVGDGTIVMNYTSGGYLFTPSNVPPAGTEITIAYDTDTGSGPRSEVVSGETWSGNDVNFNLTAPIKPGTVSLLLQVLVPTKVDTNGKVTNSLSLRRYSDSGNGFLTYNGAAYGSIDYDTGAVSVVGRWTYNQKKYVLARSSSGRYYTKTQYLELTTPVPDSIQASYTVIDTEVVVSFTDTVSAPALELDFKMKAEGNNIVPNSVVFDLDGDHYYDVGNGDIYKNKDSTTGVGTYAGTINYSTGKVTLEAYGALSSNSLALKHMLVKDYTTGPTDFVFRTPGAPMRAGSFSCRVNDMDGTLYNAVSATNGEVSAAGIEGSVDNDNGVVRLRFGAWDTATNHTGDPWYDADDVVGTDIFVPMAIIPETALYNTVYYSTLPLSADLVGIEPIRLPTDGRVPIFKSGDVVVLHHTDNEALGSSFTDSETIALSRDNLSILDLYDYQGNLIEEEGTGYSIDLATGVVTIISASIMNGYTNGGTENIVANNRIEDMLLLSEAQINGYLTTVGPITHAYPANGAQLSTALIFGDLAGRVVRMFHQKTWDGVYRDVLSGDSSTAKYDTVNYPFVIRNKGAADQRWVIKFTSSTTVDVIGETFGVIESGLNIANEIAPINPATGTPYFTISNQGWGSGWATGNNIRFDTTAANYPVWLARTTMQGPVTEPTDNFVMQIRGDAN